MTAGESGVPPRAARPSDESGAGPAALPETELKRLRLRSWRRGTREMDLILGPFADRALAGLDAPARADYEALLSENDQDLYAWVGGAAAPPASLAKIVATIRSFHALGSRDEPNND